jgi:toxin ParE1/3/4
MAWSVQLTEKAEADLELIYTYLVEHAGTTQAEAVLSKLEALCLTLSTLPGRGNVVKELAAIGVRLYREIHAGPYRVIYRQTGASDVVIICIADGRRDMRKLLRQRLSRQP